MTWSVSGGPAMTMTSGQSRSLMNLPVAMGLTMTRNSKLVSQNVCAREPGEPPDVSP